MQQTSPHAAQFMADMRAVMRDLGESELGICVLNAEGQEVQQPVPCLAHDHGHERMGADASAYSGERARIATVLVVATDVPGLLRRGDSVHLFGAEWQVRSVRKLGFGPGQVLHLSLAAEEHTRGGRRA